MWVSFAFLGKSGAVAIFRVGSLELAGNMAVLIAKTKCWPDSVDFPDSTTRVLIMSKAMRSCRISIPQSPSSRALDSSHRIYTKGKEHCFPFGVARSPGQLYVRQNIQI